MFILFSSYFQFDDTITQETSSEVALLPFGARDFFSKKKVRFHWSKSSSFNISTFSEIIQQNASKSLSL